jgi:hypothetical protein
VISSNSSAKCDTQKSTEKIKKIIRQVHSANCQEEALLVRLNPPKSLNELRHYRFKLPTAAGYLPTPEFNAKRQRQNIPDKCNNCDLHIIADQNHAINNCTFIDKFSIEVLVKNKQTMNSAVNSLLAAGIICGKNGFNIPKMTKGVASSISSGISTAFFKKIWKPYAALPANIAPEPPPPPILGPHRIVACTLCSSLLNCCCRHSAVECHFRNASGNSIGSSHGLVAAAPPHTSEYTSQYTLGITSDESFLSVFSSFQFPLPPLTSIISIRTVSF